MAESPWTTADIEDQTGRFVIITGATSGIGKEAARVLAGKNAAVLIGARNMAKAGAAMLDIRTEFPGAEISARPLDLTDLASVQHFADSVLNDFRELDVLINNAGIMMCPLSRTVDGFEIQIGTNHLGHFALTGHLLPLLMQTRGSRVVVVSSFGHKLGKVDLKDLNWESRRYDKTRAYTASKLANLYFAYELERKLRDRENRPIVTAAHPGWTSTELQRHAGLMKFLNRFFAQGVEMGALPTLRAGFDELAQSGEYFGPSGFLEFQGYPVRVQSNRRSHKVEKARKLWELSEELTGIEY
jgi:NAD(P)-dependent dehydrogenase (short-subunit alcohol dehydrogenase family)